MITFHAFTSFASFLDVNGFIEGASATVALLIIGGIVFAESGLLIGFFLPGDTLLFSAGFFAAQGHLPLATTMGVIFGAAVIGDNVGYMIGKKSGKRLFNKKDGVIFRQENVLRAEKFYEKHGGKAIIIARFVPVVRTFAPVVAGIGKMDRRKFMAYNVIGGALWTLTFVPLGYVLGNAIDPKVLERFVVLVLGIAVLITFAPSIIHLARDTKLLVFIKAKLQGKSDKAIKKELAED